MADPVEEAEVGTAETAADEGAAESEIVETEESVDEVSADADDADAEAEDAPGKGDVKYSRFKSVNDRRKTAEAKAAALEAELARLQPKEEKPQPKGLLERLKTDFERAPAGLDALQQMQFYGLQAVEKHLPEALDAWWEQKFGGKPEVAAATLAHSHELSRETILRNWERDATARGLNPKDPQLRDAVGVLMDTGRFKTFNEALDVFKGPAPKTKAAPVNGKGAEVESVDFTGLVRAKNPILNKEQAMALAAKGKRVEYKSVLDILQADGKNGA